MKRAIFYRGCTIHNYEEERGLVIITPTLQKICIKNALIFDECKWWIDRNLAKLAINKIMEQQKEDT
jgi:hypothetical protein